MKSSTTLTSAWRKRAGTPARAAVLAELKKVDSLSDVTVHEHGGLLSFTGVPISAIRRFIGALSKAKVADIRKG